MTEIHVLEEKIKEIIDQLKGLCNQNGLGNQAVEEEIITSVFLYKFLNDKFMYNINEFEKEIDNLSKEDILDNKDGIMDVFYSKYASDVAFEYPQTIEYLVNQTSKDNFYEIFDDALENISNNPLNEDFGIETAEGNREPLFNRITENVELSGRNNFAKNLIGIISQEKFDFSSAFKENFDFYSTIFEYLIKDYNVASGTYAEYYTPQAISKIIAKILVHMSPVKDISYDIYDPSAGSGSLILHLAHELGEGSFGNKAQVYTQDISAKSSRFLRINMLLNGLTDSLDNIIQGNTLLSPAHYVEDGDSSSGIKRFDFITSNPPFKMDFSSTRDTIENKWSESEEYDGLKRFFAGIPNIPPKDKDKMAVYLCFIQHILWSLKENGKAAIVVPTGFITAKTGMPKNIRQVIIEKRWLKGVIAMPPNIFANTGTNVSVIFIDKSNNDGEVILIDASKLGEKIKINKNKKTVLRPFEIKQIEETFINQDTVDNFSVKVDFDTITERKYSFYAPQYFEIKNDFEEIPIEEFNSRMENYKEELLKLFDESDELTEQLKNILDEFTS
ncbi:MAG: SAM-dependent DNA methyltransferase [Methanosphaera stadtmanae]|nr:SAM-dependent DNA methyltransferase [Methanosphaera stadtmanae]